MIEGTADRVPLDENEYRLLVESITDYAIYMLSPEGLVVTWNAGAERLKGYSAAEVVGRHVSIFYPSDDVAAGVPDAALLAARTEGRYEKEGWHVRKDGTRFWASVVIDPITSADGTLRGYAKITRDLSERRSASEALQSSEEQFRRLVQGVTDYAIYMLDPNGLITNWNSGAERIKGYKPAEIIGRPFSVFYTEEDRLNGEPQKALETARREGRFERENWRVRKDGTRFWASVVIDAIRDDHGNILGFAKITRDSTERRNAHIALEQAREQLFQAQKMEAVGQLTGGIAHDFNNLLMAVMGSLELVRKRIDTDERTLKLIDNAVQGAERGIALTRRMLAFARRQDLKLVGIDLATTVNGLIELLSPSLGPLVSIRTNFPKDLPPARTDAAQIETALLNLVVNARDAMPEGGVITISGRPHAVDAAGTGLPRGRYVRLAVSDTGEGMDAETLARAAEPFFTTKGIGKGTGLGLSMVHGLAEQSGGKLVLNSKPGKGTSAELWLPEATAVSQTAEAAPVSGGGEHRPLCIIAVDDDPLVLMNTTAMLEDLGHVVYEARSGIEALEIVRSGRPVDLVITDHAMPQMTGTELIQQLAQDRPQLPVILATGYAELPRGIAVKVPMLSKPFRQKDLAQVVQKALAQSGNDAARSPLLSGGAG